MQCLITSLFHLLLVASRSPTTVSIQGQEYDIPRLATLCKLRVPAALTECGTPEKLKCELAHVESAMPDFQACCMSTI